MQPTGRIVAVGARNEHGGGRPAGLLIGYRSDGSIDRSFGNSGRVFFPGPRDGTYTALRSIALLPGNKMLVSGYRGSRLFLARLSADGRLDRSFGGGDGEFSINLGLRGCCPIGAGLAVLSDGGAVAFASVPAGGTKLVRLRPDGSLDSSFGHRGVASDRNGRKLVEPGGVTVQRNGRIVVTGTTVRARSSDGKAKLVFGILRYLPNGRPDRSFGTGGIEFLPRGRNSIGTSALVLPSGRTVAAGGAQLITGTDPEFGSTVIEFVLLLARLRS